MGTAIVALHAEGERIVAASVRDPDGTVKRVEGDYFFSSMAIKDLVAGLDADIPASVRAIAEGLSYATSSRLECCCACPAARSQA